MYKRDRQVIALFLGGMIILTGVMLMLNPLNSPWIIEKTFVNILKIISGGFIALLGTVIFLSGISENAAECLRFPRLPLG